MKEVGGQKSERQKAETTEEKRRRHREHREMYGRTLHKKEIADRLLGNPVIEELRAAGLINETKLRDYKLVADYVDLRKSMNINQACEVLADKYCLSTETVNDIVFRK